MLLCDRKIKEYALKGMIEPFEATLVSQGVISFGLSSFGYDIRLDRKFVLYPKENFWNVFLRKMTKVFDPKNKKEFSSLKEIEAESLILEGNSVVVGKSLEYFRIPENCFALCFGKSTYARLGILVNVTPLEPGWEGYLTMCIANLNRHPVKIYSGEGIAQIVFFEGERPDVNYKDRSGKYQGATGIQLSKV